MLQTIQKMKWGGWGGGMGGRMDGTQAGRTGGTRADGAGVRDPKPTLTLICADPKNYCLWSIHSPAFTVCKCRCGVRDHPNGILVVSVEHWQHLEDPEGLHSIYEHFRNIQKALDDKLKPT